MAIAFHKKFISGIAATAILVTAFGASQAQARDVRTEQALAALLGLAVVGAIIADRKKDRRRNNAHVTTRNVPQVVSPRPLPKRAQPTRRAVLPGHCLREIETRRGDVKRIMGGRCMYRHFEDVRRLPLHCERQVRAWNGRIAQGWGARCLRQQGYRISDGGRHVRRSYDD